MANENQTDTEAEVSAETTEIASGPKTTPAEHFFEDYHMKPFRDGLYEYLCQLAVEKKGLVYEDVLLRPRQLMNAGIKALENATRTDVVYFLEEMVRMTYFSKVEPGPTYHFGINRFVSLFKDSKGKEPLRREVVEEKPLSVKATISTGVDVEDLKKVDSKIDTLASNFNALASNFNTLLERLGEKR